MTGIGPTLPPHLAAKRKREDDDEEGPRSNRDDISSQKKRTLGPVLPPHFTRNEDEVSDEDDEDGIGPSMPESPSRPTNGSGSPPAESSPSQASPTIPSKKRSKVLGPSLPPADITKRPAVEPVAEEDSDSDDDFGPSLPGSAPSNPTTIDTTPANTESTPNPPSKTGRDYWMLAPPSGSDWTSRIDPSKMKARGFASGKGSRPAATSGGDISLWTETPEEKRKRLEEEMLGIRKASQPQAKDPDVARKEAEAREMAKKVDAYNEKNRAAPLYSAKANQDDMDDPSKRAFDREKDIAGTKLNHAEQKRMLERAADFGSRFSKGSYL